MSETDALRITATRRRDRLALILCASTARRSGTEFHSARAASEMRCQHLQSTVLICDSLVRVCLFHCDKRGATAGADQQLNCQSPAPAASLIVALLHVLVRRSSRTHGVTSYIIAVLRLFCEQCIFVSLHFPILVLVLALLVLTTRLIISTCWNVGDGC